jgi:hypothetical protein
MHGIFRERMRNRCGIRRTDGRGNNGGEPDRALLELVGELLVQEIANHENCDDSHDVEDVEGRLGRNLLDGRTFDVIDDWSAH